MPLIGQSQERFARWAGDWHCSFSLSGPRQEVRKFCGDALVNDRQAAKAEAGPRLIAGPSRRRWYWRLLKLTSVVGLFVILASQVRRLPWTAALDAISYANHWWLALATIAALGGIPLWAYQWCLLTPTIHPVRLKVMAEIVTINAALQNTLPLVGGPASAIFLLTRRAGLPRGTAISIYAIDQLINGIAKIFVVGCALAMAPLPQMTNKGMILFLTVIILLSATTLVLSNRPQALQRWATSAPRPLDLVLRATFEWSSNLDVIRRLGHINAVLALAIAKKLIEILCVIAIQCASGISYNFGSAIAVVAMLGISTAIPAMPANLGIYEATIFFVYRYFGVSPAHALAAALLQHFASLVPMVIAGYILLFQDYLVSGYRLVARRAKWQHSQPKS
jgi:glycosyltransferase 2 family protein